MSLSLCYLARKAEGAHSFRRFANSYRSKAPGCAHDLVVIYKGFTDDDLAEGEAEFSGIPHKAVRVPDEHYDIGSYILAAQSVRSDYVCFVNTHTEILSDDWLKYLFDAINIPGTGIAGATASFESLYDSIAITSKAVWLAESGVPYDAKLAAHFGYVIKNHVPQWLHDKVRSIHPLAYPHGQFFEIDIDERWDRFWRHHLQPGEPHDFISGFRRFPNAHIRSNGFIIDRKVLLEFYPEIPATKKAAYAFESGRMSLSSRIMDSGLKLSLVDRHGKTYAVDEWAKSRTFRLGKQENLMLADNQTRNFENFSEAEKATLTMLTWGDSRSESANAYPMGFSFKVGTPPRFGEGETNNPKHIIDHLDYGVNVKGRHVGNVYTPHHFVYPP